MTGRELVAALQDHLDTEIVLFVGDYLEPIKEVVFRDDVYFDGEKRSGDVVSLEEG
jgi:hypothetical protein